MQKVIEFIYCGCKFEAVLTSDDFYSRALFDEVADEMIALLEGVEL